MCTRQHTTEHTYSGGRQRGVALPLIAAAMLAMLAVVGLALDASHTLANKTRLQSTTDAAALAAAIEYNDSEDISAANTVALSLFGLNADGVGNHELDAAYDASEINILIQWSAELDPFISAGVGPYVRVIATGFGIDSTLSALLGVTELDMSASAVSGPSPSIATACNIAPLVACAKDPADLVLYGFDAGEVEVLKSAANAGSAIGPGNFQLIRLDCGAGGACVRDNLAGDFDGCETTGTQVETEPGNKVGPVQGLNTRFGEYQPPLSPDDYAPDVVTRQPTPPLELFDHDDDKATPEIIGQEVGEEMVAIDSTNLDYGWTEYQADVAVPDFTHAPPIGAYERRVLAMPVAACNGETAGQADLPILGFGCFFMLQEVSQKGDESHIFGQFVENCKAGGVPGLDPGPGPGPYVIQLYKDPDSGES